MQYHQLRPLQQKGIKQLWSAWNDHNNHLINAACGFGKTAVASYICNALAHKGKRVAFIAPYITLVNQTFTRFAEYGHTDLSVIWRDDPRFDQSAKVQICSADTLVSRGQLPEVDVLIIDECHIKRKFLLEAIGSGDHTVVGLTATPYAKWLGTYYTAFHKPCTTAEAIEHGLILPPEIYCPDSPDTKGLKTRVNEFGESDYRDEDVAAIMGGAKIVGNVVSNWLERGQGMSTIGFAPNVETAKSYCAEFIRCGVASDYVTAGTPLPARELIYEKFRSGAIKVLWNVGVLAAGADFDVRVMIWCRMTKSETVWVQGTMRASRTAKGKSKWLLFDHTGTYFRLGNPTLIEYDSLHDGSDGMEEARQAARKEREKTARESECKNCGRIKHPGEFVCIECGHKPIHGRTTVEIDENRELRQVSGKAKKQPGEAEKQDFYSQLLGLMLERVNSGKTMHAKWAEMKFKDKFGVWPKNLKRIQAPCGQIVRNWEKSQRIRYAKGKAKAAAQ